MKISFYTIFFFLIVISCKKNEQSITQIYGHAGFGLNSSTSIYNENTKEAFQLCIDTKGTSGVEIDIQFSLDGTAWCFHDSELQEETDGSGFISESTDAQLNSLNYKNGHLKLCKLTQIPSETWGKTLAFDIREATKENGVYHNDSIIDRFINDCKIRFSGVKLIAIIKSNLYVSKYKDNGFEVYFDAVSIKDFYNLSTFPILDGVSISHELISQEEILTLRQQGKKTIIYSARSPKYIRKALNKNADIFLADNINGTLIEKYK